MEISQFKKLLNNIEYLEFESYLKSEILKAERKAIASIHTDEIDKESANRAKFYQEVIDIARNKVNAGKMSENKTKL